MSDGVGKGDSGLQLLTALVETVTGLDQDVDDAVRIGAGCGGRSRSCGASSSSDGLVWVTLASSRDRLLDLLLPLPGVLRTLVWLLPDRAKPGQRRSVHVTGVVEHEGTLYLGSLHETAIGMAAVLR